MRRYTYKQNCVKTYAAPCSRRVSIAFSLSCSPVTFASCFSEGPASCHICGASYAYRRNLNEHLKKHQGQTTCPLCGQQLSGMRNMRRHMVAKHGIPKHEVDTMTNKRIHPVDWGPPVMPAAAMAPQASGHGTATSPGGTPMLP